MNYIMMKAAMAIRGPGGFGVVLKFKQQLPWNQAGFTH